MTTRRIIVRIVKAKAAYWRSTCAMWWYRFKNWNTEAFIGLLVVVRKFTGRR